MNKGPVLVLLTILLCMTGIFVYFMKTHPVMQPITDAPPSKYAKPMNIPSLICYDGYEYFHIPYHIFTPKTTMKDGKMVMVPCTNE